MCYMLIIVLKVSFAITQKYPISYFFFILSFRLWTAK